MVAKRCGRSSEADHVDGCLTQSLCIRDLPFGLGSDTDVGFKCGRTRIGVRPTARPLSFRVEQLEVEVERKPRAAKHVSRIEIDSTVEGFQNDPDGNVVEGRDPS